MISISGLMNWRIDDINRVFYIVGVGLAIGAAAYLLNNKKKKGCSLAHDYYHHE